MQHTNQRKNKLQIKHWIYVDTYIVAISNFKIRHKHVFRGSTKNISIIYATFAYIGKNGFVDPREYS